MLGIEHLLPQGVCPYDTVAGKVQEYVLPWKVLIEDGRMSDHELKLVSGNGMNTVVLGALWLFILIHLKSVNEPSSGSNEM